MAGLAEWQFSAGGWLQLNENYQLAAKSSVALVETNIDERMKMLVEAGIKPKAFINGEFVSVITVDDPDGNQFVFAQGKDETHRSTMSWSRSAADLKRNTILPRRRGSNISSRNKLLLSPFIGIQKCRPAQSATMKSLRV